MTLIIECCCGQLGFTIDGEPILNGICHCDDCKKRTGSAFGLSLYVKNEQIKNRRGETQVYHINGDVKQTRYFCKVCGTTVYWALEHLPDQTGVAGGCVVSHNLPDPVYNLSVENKYHWVSCLTV